MKIIKICTIIFIVILLKKDVSANTLKEYAEYKKDNITITSYSKLWDEKKLKELYKELMRNFHENEIKYLSNIYLYDGAKYGVNAHYYDDVYIENNKYKIGKNAYIELYNADRYNTVGKMAHTLSHEYGHHFATYYLLKKEGIYGDLTKSKYANIRNLKGPLSSFLPDDDDYLYHWDISEVMADDYVQLLGSKNAKKTYDYMSIDELLEIEQAPYVDVNSFNVRPQLNPYIPLATEVMGLYEYFFNLAGYNIRPLLKPIEPTALKVTTTKNSRGEKTHTLRFNLEKGGEICEYTAVIYYKDNPFIAYPLKTFLSNEKNEVIFGAYSKKDKKGNKKTIYQNLKGEYGIKIYTKTDKGYLYETPPLYVNL